MAINLNALRNQDIAITQGRGNRLSDVFAALGNRDMVNVGGGRTLNPGSLTGGTGGRGTGPTVAIAGSGGGSDVIAYDTMLDEVRPGDLITSDFMIRLLRRINVLEAAVQQLASGGEVIVPDLFGQPLRKVTAAVKKGAGKLEFGLVLDVTGEQIDPEKADDAARVVLGQYPVPGEEVDEGTELNLLVSILPRRGEQPGGGIGGALDFARASRGGAAPGAAADATGELERVTDETPPPAAGGASKGASKAARKSPAK